MNVGAFAYLAAAAAFVILTLLLVTLWRRNSLGAWFVAACLVNGLWAAIQALHVGSGGAVPYILRELSELARMTIWFVFLFAALGNPWGYQQAGRRILRSMKGVAFGLPAVLLVLATLLTAMPSPATGMTQFLPEALAMGHVLLALCGLMLVEQLFRNTGTDKRWGVKFLCFGLGGLFAFDFYLFADALLVKGVDIDLWIARGAVNALAVPLLAISARRAPLWTGRVRVSRHVVFHSAVLLGAGIYLSLMAAAGFYIRAYGGQWGGVFQAVFFSGAVTFLIVLMLSGQTRAKLRVFVRKHFFQSKYDYRKEWLRFADVLSESDQQEDVRQRILKGVAEIVESPSGAMWQIASHGGYYEPAALWNLPGSVAARVSPGGSLIRFMVEKKWIIDLKEYATDPGRYAGLELPQWLEDYPDPRLIVPLFHHDHLDGFIVLGEPRAQMQFDWEDHDLLKTVGGEAASYLRLIETSEALSEARQFEAFNRLSAYVVHDLKNLVAQLSLVATNAKKYKHHPEFIADAFSTVEDSVAKMNRMLTQLRKERTAAGSGEIVDLESVVRKVIAERSAMQPVPELIFAQGELLTIADPDRLEAVVGHIIQNAQEATDRESGSIEVKLHEEGGWVTLEVRDNGCGMDEQFIRGRLFRPFDTTKGNAGMGVGAYESREFVRECGGDVEVTSQPGRGTSFLIRLPRYQSGRAEQASYAAME